MAEQLTQLSRYLYPVEMIIHAGTPNSKVGGAIGNIDLVFWDDIVICHRHSIETLDRTFRDTTQIHSEFGRLDILHAREFGKFFR